MNQESHESKIDVRIIVGGLDIAQLVSKAVNNFIRIDAEKSWGTPEIYTTEDLKKYGIYPECTETPLPSAFADDNCCKLPIGCLWADLGFSNGLFSNGHIDVIFNSSDKVKECISFLSAGWENIISSDLWGTQGGITIAPSQTGLYAPHPESFYAGAKTKISLDDITNLCTSACQNGTWCNVSLIFRGDL